MSVFLGHHRNIDRVNDGTNNETLRQLFHTRSLASHTQVLSEPCNKRSPVTKAYRSRNHLGTLFIAFLGYAIEEGLVLYFRAGREVKAIREDCPPGKEEGKRCCHLSRPIPQSPALLKSKCSSPVPPNAPISRQRSCECAVMLRMLRHRIDRPSSRSFPVHSLYISDTQGRTRWEGSSPSLCPTDHSAGISHSRPRLTAARGCRPSLIGKSLPFPSNDPASPGSSAVRASFPPYAMLPRRRPTMLRACGVFGRRSLPVVPSSPLAVWAGCPSLLRSVRVVMITPGYALAPLTGTPEPANARENPGRSVLHSSDRRCG
ncbi:hypothetical protein ACH5RR_003130 [Cinchona calisaya]|uniref:Uncharacterized protein n=1 Tax=Cinchona calisaya TaxID=153742 RepID=A0ABD3AU28_9GENT